MQVLEKNNYFKIFLIFLNFSFIKIILFFVTLDILTKFEMFQ